MSQKREREFECVKTASAEQEQISQIRGQIGRYINVKRIVTEIQSDKL